MADDVLAPAMTNADDDDEDSSRPFNRVPKMMKLHVFARERVNEQAKLWMCVQWNEENNQQSIDVNLRDRIIDV